MSNLVYYVYNDIDNGVYCLDLLNDIITRSLSFWFNSHGEYHFLEHEFNSKSEFLRFLNEANDSTANLYTKTFVIAPPYFVKQSLHPEMDVLSTCIVAYGRISTFVAAGGPTGRENGTELEKFLFMNRGRRFDIGYLVRIHKFLINSKVVRPIVNDGRPLPRTLGDILFDVALGTDNIVTARIEKRCGFFLNLDGCTNDQIFKNYGIEKASLQRFLTKPMVATQYWPEDTLDSLARIVNYINNNFYAFCGLKTTFSISGNEIMFFGTPLFVSQLKNGKWYIKGDMEKICQLFSASTCAELRRFVDRTLGEKIRHGVFPECDSRDEIFKLLDKVKNV